MMTDRSLLEGAAGEAIRDSRITIESDGGETRIYTLRKMLGKGKTGVAWQAMDALGRDWAIKFVLRADYQTHSLAAEAVRVAKLRTRLLAHIDFYGKPKLEPPTVDLQQFYAIVVEWVAGESLKTHLQRKGDHLTVKSLLRIARSLCEVVAELRANKLSHNDLHEENVIISQEVDQLTNEESLDAIIIDTGTLKTYIPRNAAGYFW